MATNRLQMPKLSTGKPEISMAPLIDVVFLLLIFFVVTTVFPENRGFVIEKPESSMSEQLALKKITFTLTKDGGIAFEDKAISVSDIERLIKESLRANPDIAVLIQADKRATTDILIKTMDAIKAAGIKRVGIATQKLNGAGQ